MNTRGIIAIWIALSCIILFNSCSGCDGHDESQDVNLVKIRHRKMYPNIVIRKQNIGEFYKVYAKYYGNADSFLIADINRNDYKSDTLDVVYFTFRSIINLYQVRIISDSLKLNLLYDNMHVRGSKSAFKCSYYKLTEITAQKNDSLVNITDGIVLE